MRITRIDMKYSMWALPDTTGCLRAEPLRLQTPTLLAPSGERSL